MLSWKKIAVAVIKWTLLGVYLVISLAFVNEKSQHIVCSKVEIIISDSLDVGFVTKKDVLRTIVKQNGNLIGIPLNSINTHEMEEKLKEILAIRNVEVYAKIDGRVVVDVVQRTPIVRVFNRHGESYYIDSEGRIMPLSSKFTSHVLVVNGNISEPFDIAPNIRVMDWKSVDSEPDPIICRLYEFSRFITSDDFWNAQITQIYVDRANHIELIPRVGSHTILLGRLDDYERKLKNLRLFYETALPQEGWNKYKQINLKFKNQIVCTKK